MAGFTLTEAAIKRIVKDCLFTESLIRNSRARRRRHVTISPGGNVTMFRLEEELVRGMAANARQVDPSSLTTKPGPQIIVRDDENKWFGRGSIAPSGDDGGDAKGDANLGFALKANATAEGTGGSGELDVYSVISVGTWFRWIKGVLLGSVWQVNAEHVTGHDGEWPRSDSGTAKGTITLAPLSCLEAAAGIEFMAKFNEITKQYEVTTACCP